MQMMRADTWTVLLALRLTFASSVGQHSHVKPPQIGLCETQSLRASLGSSVILPCVFSTNALYWVTWGHVDKRDPDMVLLSSNGRVRFVDPRHGRVKTFPNQASVGNFSICIDEIEESDLGSYTCKQNDKCFQVDLLQDKSMLDEDRWRPIYIGVGVTTLILLCAAVSYKIYRHLKQQNTNPQGLSYNVF